MRMVESAKNMEPNIVKKPTAMQLSKARIEAESAFNELQNAIGKVKDTDNLTITTPSGTPRNCRFSHYCGKLNGKLHFLCSGIF